MRRRILTFALIALAGAGGWAAIQQARHSADLPAVRQQVVTTRPGVAPEVIQVTYFSSDVRCATCVRIERLTRETVAKNFAAELASGLIVLQTINLDGPGNEHFVQDYQLVSKTVIVSDRAKGQEVQWENLQEVWSKQKDEQAFETYIVDAVRRHLGSMT
jgi:hypothetical protein